MLCIGLDALMDLIRKKTTNDLFYSDEYDARNAKKTLPKLHKRLLARLQKETNRDFLLYDLQNEAARLREEANLYREDAERFQNKDKGMLKILCYLLMDGYTKISYLMEDCAKMDERTAKRLEKQYLALTAVK